MENEITTTRLKLVRLLSKEEDSIDFAYYHTVWGNELATQWSPRGPCKTIEESQNWMAGVIPAEAVENPAVKIAYAVLGQSTPSTIGQHDACDLNIHDRNLVGRSKALEDNQQVIGIVTLLQAPTPSPVMAHAPVPDTTNLALELGYLFLPSSWGHGYATESTNALLEQYRSFISRSSQNIRVDIQASIHCENIGSLRVAQKLGFQEGGCSEKEEQVFLGGRTRRNRVLYFRMTLFP